VSLQERRQASQHILLLANFHSDPARALEETAAVNRQQTTWAGMPGLLV
jgi:hypothetical protein